MLGPAQFVWQEPAALAGVIILARKGKYSAAGTVNAIPGANHHLPP